MLSILYLKLLYIITCVLALQEAAADAKQKFDELVDGARNLQELLSAASQGKCRRVCLPGVLDVAHCRVCFLAIGGMWDYYCN